MTSDIQDIQKEWEEKLKNMRQKIDKISMEVGDSSEDDVEFSKAEDYVEEIKQEDLVSDIELNVPSGRDQEGTFRPDKVVCEYEMSQLSSVVKVERIVDTNSTIEAVGDYNRVSPSNVEQQINSLNISNSHMYLLKGLTDDIAGTTERDKVNLETRPDKSNTEEDNLSDTELNKEIEDSIVLDNKEFIIKEVGYETNQTVAKNSAINTSEHKIKPLDITAHSRENKEFREPKATDRSKLDQSKYIPDQQLLHKIEVVEHEKELETQKAMEEIHALEAGLKLDQRLYHDKWMIRKNAYREVGELLSFLFEKSDNEVERLQAVETFSPWLKYFISDINVGSLAEGLNTFYIFLTHCVENRHKALIEFFDELEKLVSLDKSSIMDLCKKIILFGLGNKKQINFTFNELLKKLNTNNNKLLKFVIDLFSNILRGDVVNESHLKIIFEKSVVNFNSASKMEKKILYKKLIQEIYSIIEDDFDVIKKFYPQANTKDMEKVFKNVKKQDNGFILYEKPIDVKESAIINTTELEEPVHEANDLFAILPIGFLEYQNLDSFGPRKAILESFNNKLVTIHTIKEKDRDYIQILKVLQEAIDDSNVLVHTEAIKCLAHIGRLLKMSINQSKLRALIISSLDLFKDKKSSIKLEMYNMFDSIITNFCIGLDSFLTLILQQANGVKIPIVKQGLLEYVKGLFNELDDDGDSVLIKGIINNLSENDYITFSKLLAEIIKNETQPNIKDLCVDIMITFKHRVRNENKLKTIIELLPQYRKTMVIEEKNTGTADLNEREYKAGLKRIKSNLSFRNLGSTSKETGLRSTGQQMRSVSRGRDTGVKNKLSSKSAINTEESMTVTSKQKNLKRLNTEGSKPQHKKQNSSVSANIKKVEVEDSGVNTSVQEIKKNELLEKIMKKKREQKKVAESIETLQSVQSVQSSGRNKALVQKMDSAIDYIYTLDGNELQEYGRTILRDFLSFIKKESNKDSRENLDEHFLVILNILEKIYDQMAKTGVSEDIYLQTFKIIVMAPCFLEKNYNELAKFIKKIRRMINDDDQFYAMYSEILFKFFDINTGEAFLKGVNPKGTILLYFEYFLNKENMFKIYSETFDSLLDVIDRITILSDNEKERYHLLYKELSRGRFEKKHEEHEDHEEEKGDSGHHEISHIDVNHNLSAFTEKDLNHCIYGERLETIPTKEPDEDWKNRYEQEKEARMETQKELYIHDLETKRMREKLSQLARFRTEKTEQIEKVEQAKPEMFKVDTDVMKSGDLDITNKSDISNSILRIKEQLRRNCSNLDSKIQRLGNTIEKKTIEGNNGDGRLNESELDNINILNNNIFKPQKSLEEVYNDDHKVEPSKKFTTLSSEINYNPYISENPLNVNKYSSLIMKIPTNLLDDRVSEIALYVELESIFFKINLNNKQTFTNELRKVLDNQIMIRNCSFNCFLQLVEFLLKLLTNVYIIQFTFQEIKNNTNYQGDDKDPHRQVIITIQLLISELLETKALTETFKILMHLLKKYLPKDFRVKMDGCKFLYNELATVLYLKTITFLIKEMIKFKENTKQRICCKDILHDINELFMIYPPSKLIPDAPDLDVLDKTYKILRELTDIAVVSDPCEAKMYLDEVKGRQGVFQYCQVYLNYIENRLVR
jgi:hypothetical protein